MLLTEPELDDQLPTSINRALLELAALAEELYRRKGQDPRSSLLVLAGTAVIDRRAELLDDAATG